MKVVVLNKIDLPEVEDKREGFEKALKQHMGHTRYIIPIVPSFQYQRCKYYTLELHTVIGYHAVRLYHVVISDRSGRKTSLGFENEPDTTIKVRGKRRSHCTILIISFVTHSGSAIASASLEMLKMEYFEHRMETNIREKNLFIVTSTAAVMVFGNSITEQ